VRTLPLLCAVLAWSPFATTIVYAESTSDPLTSAGRAPAPDVPTGALALDEAITAALRGNPELAAFSWEVRSREARALQAGLLPNPEIFVEVENVAGSGERRSFDAAETTYGVSQLIELGGKRPKRRRLTDLERALAALDHDIGRLDVIARTSQAFVATLVAQRRVALVRDVEAIAGRSLRTAEDQHGAGATSSVEVTRAALEHSRTRVRLMRAERDLEAKRRALAATWGSDAPAFSSVRGTLDFIAPPPPLTELERRLEAGPSAVRWATEIERHHAAVAVERAARVPDPTLGVGGRRFFADESDALVFEVSVPLPLFDRNRGQVLAASHAVEKARAEQAAAIRRLRSELAGRHQALSTAFEEVRILEAQTLPAATATFEEARRSHVKGLLHSLDVLDAQQTLFAVRDQHLDALAAYHEARVEIERLTATEVAP